MKAYLKLLKYELKNLLRDPMNMFLFVYPLFMLGMVGWAVPAIIERSGINNQSPEYALTMIILFVMVLSIGGFISGALLGFSLLENKDEQTIKAIAVTPMSVRGYIIFKSIYSFVFGWLGNLVMLFGLQWFFADAYSFEFGEFSFGIANIDPLKIIIFSAVSSLLTPTAGALIAAISKNKIEGFAIMKSGGIVLIIPGLILFETFSDWKQYVLGLTPNFWPVKAFYNEALNLQGPDDLSFYGYLIIGSIYMIGIAILSINFFTKRSGAERG
jgi:fluoroquinolone transport system permease protein